MESYYREITIALIGAIASIVVARIQARVTATKKGDEAVVKAASAAKATAHDVLTNGVYRDMREQIARLQTLSDIQAARLNTFTVVALEKEELTDKLADTERALAECLAQKAPKP